MKIEKGDHEMKKELIIVLVILFGGSSYVACLQPTCEKFFARGQSG